MEIIKTLTKLQIGMWKISFVGRGFWKERYNEHKIEMRRGY